MRGRLLAVFVGMLWSSSLRLVLAAPGAPSDAIYAYTDDRGRLVHVSRLSDVPERLRSQAQRVDQPDLPTRSDPGVSAAVFDWVEQAIGAEVSKAPELFHYRGPSGRVVYTNIADSVPREQRAGARINLEHVSLNSPLAADLNQQLARQHRALQAAPVCTSLRAAVQEPWWSRVWREHAPLVVCGGALLLCVLLTPWMFSKGWGASWARVLSTATPVLGLVGVSAYLLMQTERGAAALHTRADRCETSTFQRAGGLQQRLQLVQALQAEQKALAQIHAESL